MEKKVKKIPMRRCVGCNEHKPKAELLRVVRDPEGGISLDFRGKKSGRGAYICRDVKCLKKARKTKRIDSNLGVTVPEEVYDRMESEISDISVRYISDFEFGDFIKTLKSKIQMDLEDKFRLSDTSYEVLNDTWQKDLGFRTATKAEAIKKSINEFQASFSFDAITASIESDYSTIIGNIKKLFANDIFSNLKQSIDECKKNKSDREKEIEKAKKQCEVFENKKQELQRQLKEIENL